MRGSSQELPAGAARRVDRAPAERRGPLAIFDSDSGTDGLTSYMPSPII
jgi:hypothetical protein